MFCGLYKNEGKIRHFHAEQFKKIFFFFLRIETSIINYYFVKKVWGRPVPIGRVGLPETHDFFLGLTICVFCDGFAQHIKSSPKSAKC